MLVFHAPSIPDDKQQKHHQTLHQSSTRPLYIRYQVTETLTNDSALLLDTQMHMPMRRGKYAPGHHHHSWSCFVNPFLPYRDLNP
jgi:hypothetical protein